MPQVISSNRINVTVGVQVFSIPAQSVNEVVLLLSRLQSIQLTENPSPLLEFRGKRLIEG